MSNLTYWSPFLTRWGMRMKAEIEFPIDVYLRDTVTGFEHVHSMVGSSAYEFGDPFAEFIWSEGNFSCDCNRSLFITEWGTIGPQELQDMANDESGRCPNTERIVVDRIIRTDTGETVYTEP